jgi:protein kinase-like protein/FHA domain-containing protein
MLDAFGLAPRTNRLPFLGSSEPPEDDLGLGSLVDRHRVKRVVDRWDGGALLLAHDSMLDRDVTLKWLDDAGSGTAEELLRQEVVLARAVSHRSICRVHDLVSSRWGSMLVMEPCDGTLAHRLDRMRANRSLPSMAEFRTIARALGEALTFIHERGLVHGAVNPSNIVLSGSHPRMLFGPATERERLLSGPGLDRMERVDPRYFSVERLCDGHTSRSDDVYALCLVLWELLYLEPPSLGMTPRSSPLLEQLRVADILELTVAELKVLYDGLDSHPVGRSHARTVFGGLFGATEEHRGVHPGPPPGRTAEFQREDQGLLVLRAPSAPTLVGTLVPLEKPRFTLGRAADVSLPERTLSRVHARFQWTKGCWIVGDAGSANGLVAERTVTLAERVVLRHGGHLQLGDLSVQLVRFPPSSVLHWRARRFLEGHDGLTGLELGVKFHHAAEDRARFADWTGLPLHVATFGITLAAKLPRAVGGAVLRLATERILDTVAAQWSGLATAGLTGRARNRPGSETKMRLLLLGPWRTQPDAALDAARRAAARVLPKGCRLVLHTYTREHGEPIGELL